MITAARVPANSLTVLAPLRAESRIRIDSAADMVWVRWPAELSRVLELLRPVPGVELFEQRPPRWYRAGRRLPSSIEPPNGDGESLASRLAPARLQPQSPELSSITPTPWLLRQGGAPRAATALRCELARLQRWAELATTTELQSLKAARSGDHVRVLGTNLPSIPGAIRYYGQRLFLPLGWVPEPDLGESLLAASIGLATDEYAFLHQDRVEVIPTKAFHPLTRAGIRLAATPRVPA